MTVLQNRLNSIFNDFARPEIDEESLAMGSFIPPVDVYEDGHQMVLKLEVPGISQQDLDVHVENQTLTVKGERKFEKDEKEENFHRIERRYGTFTRSFALPQTVDAGSVRANYDNGVLTVSLAKKEAAKPKQVKVEIGSGANGQPRQLEGKAA
jgi:HSP20 family protein